ncbi:AAA family ATPase [Lentzea flaviverrucosa]|uniref:AAA domain (Dynein-related subfamily) n=1 Tax=Lentzea flaviverrucosa TaxID=200379 RepID=A0A1H9XTN6_9PSEU|nr:MoxR family ATPase [Lentzea flaviverrucosa]RDI19203.1 dynein-related subfamily AAA family protein [Lentzea flaviverrucosa]SES49409.1 AAA domain (dynein-related subfamily) [Lentzea flaviverrucosa]
MSVRERGEGGRRTGVDAPDWWIYRGTGREIHDIDLAELLPPPPPWRDFQGGPLPENDVPRKDDGEADRRLGPEINLAESDVDEHELDVVNAALYLRRPLLLTGKPGVGKSSLAWRVARELRLGRVLRWSITSRTTLNSGLFDYDAIGRVQAAAGRAQSGSSEETSIGEFVRLGPLGTAFLPGKLPRVVLIDELDKSESDLPNDLLSIFEDGEFVIPELARVRNQTREVTVHTNDPNGTATVVDGRVGCRAFPIVVMTSNGEREFPPAFLRRVLQLEIKDPTVEQLAAMVANHLLDAKGEHRERLVREFIEKSRAEGGLPADRLLDAVYLATSGAYQPDDAAWQRLLDALWRRLNVDQ